MINKLDESVYGSLREEIAMADQTSSFQQACAHFWMGILDCIAGLQAGRLSETEQAFQEVILPGLTRLVSIERGSDTRSRTTSAADLKTDLKQEEAISPQATSSLTQSLVAASYLAFSLCGKAAKLTEAKWPEAAARHIIGSLSSLEVDPHGNRAVVVYPIGYVENDVEELLPPKEIKAHLSRIVVDPALSRGLDGLAGNQRLLVVFQFHRLEGYELHQHPKNNPRLPKTGVFSLHSPRRPNPIGVTEVDLLERKDNVLLVKGLDAVNGTPVLDLKLNK